MADSKPMTLGRLVLETAHGTVKERTITGKELDEIRVNMARYFKGPLQFREPLTDSEGPVIYDAAGNQVAMLYWPTHPVEETGAAEQATYALGHAMAAALDSGSHETFDAAAELAFYRASMPESLRWDQVDSNVKDAWRKNTQKALKQHKPGCPKEAARIDGIDRWYTLDCDCGSQSEETSAC